jgi:hypothetical protein
VAPYPGYMPATGHRVIQKQFDYHRIWQVTLPMFERTGTTLVQRGVTFNVGLKLANSGVASHRRLGSHVINP